MTSKERIKGTSESEDENYKEMKQRLIEVGLFENGITIQEMKKYINVLDESAKNAEENNVHQIPQAQTSALSPSIDGIVNVSPSETPSENSTEAPKMSYSNATRNRKSPTLNLGHGRRKSSEGNSASENSDLFITKETPKPASKEHDKKQQRRKKISMDPLKVILNENDKPLKQPERMFVTECESFSLCNDLKNSAINPKELVPKVSDFLQEVRDEWIAHNIPEEQELEFQWGSPIQVGSRNFNLDRKSVTRNEPEVIEPVKESRSRASKRKAASIIDKINHVSDSDLESDDESTLLKRRKSQQERKNTTTGGSDVQMDVDQPSEVFEMPSTSSSYFANETKIQDSSDEDIFEFRVKSKSPDSFQPRRIVPPVPGTNKARRGRGRGATINFKGPRAKKSTENTKKTVEREAIAVVKKSVPPEIVLDCEDLEFDDLSKSIDVKILKVPLTEKIKLATLNLEDKKIKEQKIVEQKKFYESMFEEKAKKERGEHMRKRLEEEEKAKRLAREKEEKENEKKKMWNKVLNDSVKQKKEKPKALSDEDIRIQLDEDEVIVCDDQSLVHAIGSTSENRVLCPICNKFYPESEIQDHASGCNQFEDATQDTLSSVTGSRRKRNNGIKLKCNICKEYETLNESDFMEHVEICIEQRRNRETSTVSVNEVEYQGQFPSGRKRFNPKGQNYN